MPGVVHAAVHCRTRHRARNAANERKQRRPAKVTRAHGAPKGLPPEIKLKDLGKQSLAKQNCLGAKPSLLTANHRPEVFKRYDGNPFRLSANFLEQNDVKFGVKVLNGVDVFACNIPRGPIDLTWCGCSWGSMEVAIQLPLHSCKVKSR